MSAFINPVVTTTNGRVRGKQMTGLYGDQYYCFDGIPYAKPPLAELRFKPPEELLEHWEGVRDCTRIPLRAPQHKNFTKSIPESEDCLYLNINVKKLQSATLLPVIVFLHGGGFCFGDATRSTWGPDYFMMQDVVFISIGSRLGVFGFLYFSDPFLKIPGNAGLKDQVMALRWIKNNCANFNGNPENITLLGNSSGSCSTHFLMLAPQCRDLFHKAILMSGFCNYFQREKNLAYRLACALGYKGENNDRKVYEYLLKLDTEELILHPFELWTKEERNKGYEFAFMPAIEPYETPDAIFTREPMEILRTTWTNEIPIMLGVTSFEGLVKYKYFTQNPGIYDIFGEHPEYLLPQEWQLKCDLRMQKKLGRDILNIFFGTKILSIENFNDALKLHSFTTMNHPLHRILLSRQAYSSAPTFLYRFDFDSPTFNHFRIKICGPDVRGVTHADDLSYIFLLPNSDKLSAQSPEYKTILRMISMWTTFAAKSDPNTDLIRPAIWKPIERSAAYKCLNINHTIEFMEFPEQTTCAQMDEVYKQTGFDLY